MNELTIILILLSIFAVVIIFNVIFYNKVCGIADRVVEDENKERELSKRKSDDKVIKIPKYASPLAFDDRILYCKNLDEVNSVASFIEKLLTVKEHIWHPQELLQLLLLVKYYLGDNNLESVLSYQFLRYIESLVMHLNVLNVSMLDTKAKDYDNFHRNIIFDEINHCYFLAKDLKKQNDKSTDKVLQKVRKYLKDDESAHKEESRANIQHLLEADDSHENKEEKNDSQSQQEGADEDDSVNLHDAENRTYRKIIEVPDSDSIKTKTEESLIDADKRLIDELKKRGDDEEIPDSVKNYSPS